MLGHHLGDRRETSQLAMMRGCDLWGRRGIAAIRPHWLDPTIMIVSPLLSWSQAEIQACAREHEVPFHHDVTNDDPTVSLRNRLRLSTQWMWDYPQFAESVRRDYAVIDEQIATRTAWIREHLQQRDT